MSSFAPLDKTKNCIFWMCMDKQFKREAGRSELDDIEEITTLHDSISMMHVGLRQTSRRS